MDLGSDLFEKTSKDSNFYDNYYYVDHYLRESSNFSDLENTDMTIGSSSSNNFGVASDYIASNTSEDKSEIIVDTSTEKSKSIEKLVYTSQLSLKTKDLKVSVKSIKDKLTQYQGIISGESFYLDRYNGSNTVQLSLRIPQQYYEEFLTNIEESTGMTVTSLKKSVSNLTETYADNESKLKSLHIQEARLFF